MRNYLIRLDDACPYMDSQKWKHMEEILDKYSIKPLVGIIPANEKEDLFVSPEDPLFWERVHSWIKKGWSIALHGYDHVYISKSGGINPFWRRSEFADVQIGIQKEKIRKGIGILKKHSIYPKYFFAPSHTYDNNTLEALKSESDIRIISDSIGTKPYHYHGFTFIPQIIGHCTVPPLSGLWTFCLHPNVMKDEDFVNTEVFIKEHHKEFLSFEDLEDSNIRGKSFFDHFLSFLFFSLRRLKGAY